MDGTETAQSQGTYTPVTGQQGMTMAEGGQINFKSVFDQSQGALSGFGWFDSSESTLEDGNFQGTITWSYEGNLYTHTYDPEIGWTGTDPVSGATFKVKTGDYLDFINGTRQVPPGYISVPYTMINIPSDPSVRAFRTVPEEGSSVSNSSTETQEEALPESDLGNENPTLDNIRLAADLFGLIPGVGIIGDVTSAVISIYQGDYAAAGASLIAALPGIGIATGVAFGAIKAFNKVKKN